MQKMTGFFLKQKIAVGVLGILFLSIGGILFFNQKSIPKQVVIFNKLNQPLGKLKEHLIAKTDTVQKINEEWIYYSAGEDQQKLSLMRFHIIKKEEQKVVTDIRSWQIMKDKETGESYICYTKSGEIWRSQLDGSEAEQVCEALIKDSSHKLVDKVTSREWFISDVANGIQVVDPITKEIHYIEGAIITKLVNNTIINNVILHNEAVYYVDFNKQILNAYDMKTKEIKVLVIGEDYMTEPAGEDRFWSPDTELLDIVENDMYFTINRGYYTRTVFRQQLGSNKKANLFYEVSGGLLDEYCYINIVEGYLYANYASMRHSIIREQVSLKDGKCKSYGESLGRVGDWIYKLDYTSLNKFNQQTQENVKIRDVYPLHWYTQYKERNAHLVGEWIYFQDYDPIDEGRYEDNLSERPFYTYRMNINTQKEEEVSQSLYDSSASIYNMQTTSKEESYWTKNNVIYTLKADSDELVWKTKIGRIDRFEVVEVETELQITLQAEQEVNTMQVGDEKLVVYNTDPIDTKIYYSSSNNQVVSVSQEGVIIAYRPGHSTIMLTGIKNGYRRAIRTFDVKVEGKPIVEVQNFPQLHILEKGEILTLKYAIPDGSTLKGVSGDVQIVAIESEGTVITLTAQALGVANIYFSVDKVGNTSNTLTQTVVVLDRSKINISDLVKVSTKGWKEIATEDRGTAAIRQRIAQEAEQIIAAISKDWLKQKKGQIQCDSKTLERALQKALAAQAEVNNRIYEENIVLLRELEIKLKVEIIQPNHTERIDLILDKEVLKPIAEKAGELEIIFKDMGMSIGIDLLELDELFGDKKLIKVGITNKGELYTLNYLDETDTPLEKLEDHLNVNIYLSKEAMKEAASQTIAREVKGTSEQIATQLNLVEGAMSFKTKYPGSYKKQFVHQTFKDIATLEDRSKEAVKTLTDKGIIPSSESFRPNDLITRGEFASIMVNTFYALDPSAIMNFKDISRHDPNYSHIASAAQENIIKGYPDNTFRADQFINKEQIICIMTRALVGYKGYIAPPQPEMYLMYYNDQNEISDWAETDVALAIREQLIQVPPDNYLQPQKGMNRAEVAVMVNDLFNKLY